MKMKEITEDDLERYDRQIMIDGFGEEGQKELKSTRALIAGAGGLGSPASIYLAVAGIGELRIVDDDVVELNNLNRQTLYREKDVGKSKAEVAEEVLKSYNEDIEIEGIKEKITDDNIDRLAAGCDLIVDCMDNYPTRYVLNRASLEKEIPMFHAAVSGMRGQATTLIPGRTPCLKCIVPSPPPSKKFPVLGATPGLLATIQVHEVIKYAVGIGDILENELLIVENGSEFDKIEIKKNPDCEECG